MVCWREFTDLRFRPSPATHTSVPPPCSSAPLTAELPTDPRSYTLEASFGGADAEHEPRGRHFGIRRYEAIGADLCRAVSRFFLRDATARAALHEAILARVALVPLPAGADSDDEAGEDGPGPAGEGASSDDDSDDDTVESIVLPAQSPARSSPQRQRAAKAAKRKPKGSRPTPPPAGGSRRADAKAAATAALAAAAIAAAAAAAPKSPLGGALGRREPTPREEGQRATGRPLERRVSELRPDRRAGSGIMGTDGGACSCASCQVYAEFIAAGPGPDPRPWTGESRDGAGRTGESSPTFGRSGPDEAGHWPHLKVCLGSV